MSNTPNEINTERQAYSQNFADTLGIFWQFHKERLATGNISFAMISSAENHPPISFNPEIGLQKSREDGHLHYSVLSDFAHATTNTLVGSWQQFLDGLGMYHSNDVLDMIEVPEHQQRYFTGYTKTLARKTEHQAQIFHPDLEDSTISTIGDIGGFTGAEATVQLAALLGEQFTPQSALMLSKIALDNIAKGLAEIGISDYDQQGNLLEGTYTLFDNSKVGLDLGKLTELGYGSTFGCPAGIKITAETKRFLGSIDVEVGTKTMLGEFASMMPSQLRTNVLEWYRGLTFERKLSVTEEAREILDGHTMSDRRAELQIRRRSKEK